MDGYVIENGIVVAHVRGLRDVRRLPPGQTFVEGDCGGARIGQPLPWPRAERDRRLGATDWTELPSVQATMTAEQQRAWAEYRQALRGLPESHPDSARIAWPVPPGRGDPA